MNQQDMFLKETMIEELILREGGYINDSSDSGGETNYGITKAVARSHGYSGAMKDLDRGTAFDIYANDYWDSVLADDLLKVDVRVAEEVVDTAINCGRRVASESLQRMLNALNNRELYYDDIEEDGYIGKDTINALKEYAENRSIEVLLTGLNCLQGAYYIVLSEKREKDEKFLYGWLSNRIVL